MTPRTRIGPAIGLAAGLAWAAFGASVAAAHGGDLPPAPDVAGLLFGWSFDATVWIPLLATALLYLWAVRRVNAAHPGNPVPLDRSIAFYGGLAAIAVALQGGIERWDTTLFSIHMIQHLLLIFAAAPLLAMAAPVTLVLRLASPRVRQRRLIPILHSRALRIVSHPLTAWLLFSTVMWGSHLSPLFDLALRVVWVHDLEHLLYLVSALLFWWPIVGRDPVPWRMGYPARLMYLFSQMPINSFLGVVILFSTRILYPAYATTGRTWGPPPLDDQQFAGAIMWGLGDAAFLVAILLVIAAWMRREETDTLRREAVLDSQTLALSLRGPAGGGTAGMSPPAGTSGDWPAAGSIESAPAAPDLRAQPGIGAARQAR